MITALDLLEKALQTYRLRNATYGQSYELNGAVMKALFPNGMPECKTEMDHNRQIVFHMLITKFVRYCQHFNDPHTDSIHDLGVYAFIMEELDTKLLQEKDCDIPFTLKIEKE